MIAQDSTLTDSSFISDSTLSENQAVLAKENMNYNVGLASSVGLLKGESFSGGLPVGGTLVLTTPFGFNLGPLKYTVSLV